jgi:hypothetical protein
LEKDSTNDIPKLKSTKIEKAVVKGYKAVEEAVVSGYKTTEKEFSETFLKKENENNAK